MGREFTIGRDSFFTSERKYLLNTNSISNSARAVPTKAASPINKIDIMQKTPVKLKLTD